MKTNKSYTKRLKVTRNGKILARKTGQSHFNAQESGKTNLAKKRTQKIQMSNKAKARFLPNK